MVRRLGYGVTQVRGAGDCMLSLAERCRPIRLLVVDVDGSLTAGGIVYGSGDNEQKRFHVRDGWALKEWTKAGRSLAVLTGRSSDLVERRGMELGAAWVIQGAKDKSAAWDGLLRDAGVRPGEVAVLGDDEPDLPLFQVCGLGAAPADAASQARRGAHLVLRKGGGDGAARELLELLMRCQGIWPGH